MKKTEVRKFIVDGVKNTLGGKFKKLKYDYLKNIGELYFLFGIRLVDCDNSFPATFGGGFGNLGYTKLFNFIIEKTNINIQKNDFFTPFSYGQIRLFDEGKYPVLEYDIYTDGDAQKMVDEVSDYILHQILPEWEANPTIVYLEKKVNEVLKDIPNFSGLILAKLVGSPNYSAVNQHYQNVSKDWNDWDKQDLEKVISFLDSHSQEELLKIAEM